MIVVNSFIISSSVILRLSSTTARICNEDSLCRSFTDSNFFIYSRGLLVSSQASGAYKINHISTRLCSEIISAKSIIKCDLCPGAVSAGSIFGENSAYERASITLRTLP